MSVIITYPYNYFLNNWLVDLFDVGDPKIIEKIRSNIQRDDKLLTPLFTLNRDQLDSLIEAQQDLLEYLNLASRYGENKSDYILNRKFTKNSKDKKYYMECIEFREENKKWDRDYGVIINDCDPINNPLVIESRKIEGVDFYFNEKGLCPRNTWDKMKKDIQLLNSDQPISSAAPAPAAPAAPAPAPAAPAPAPAPAAPVKKKFIIKKKKEEPTPPPPPTPAPAPVPAPAPAPVKKKFIIKKKKEEPTPPPPPPPAAAPVKKKIIIKKKKEEPTPPPPPPPAPPKKKFVLIKKKKEVEDGSKASLKGDYVAEVKPVIIAPPPPPPPVPAPPKKKFVLIKKKKEEPTPPPPPPPAPAAKKKESKVAPSIPPIEHFLKNIPIKEGKKYISTIDRPMNTIIDKHIKNLYSLIEDGLEKNKDKITHTYDLLMKNINKQKDKFTSQLPVEEKKIIKEQIKKKIGNTPAQLAKYILDFKKKIKAGIKETEEDKIIRQQKIQDLKNYIQSVKEQIALTKNEITKLKHTEELKYAQEALKLLSHRNPKKIIDDHDDD